MESEPILKKPTIQDGCDIAFADINYHAETGGILKCKTKPKHILHNVSGVALVCWLL